MNTPISTLLERKNSQIQSVNSSATVAEAVATMNHHRIGAILVLDGENLVGIFTERDVLRRVVGAGLDPGKARVADMMTKNLVTVTPDTTVEQSMVLFTEKRCRHLPVIGEGKLVGLVSIGDVTRWMVDLHRTECEHLKNYIAGGFPTAS
jgi:CBS domain-containing protein